MATLLTGAGYIGAALLQQLPAMAHPVVALDDFYSTSRESLVAALPSGTTLIEGNVADPRDVASAFDALGSPADITVFHLAAQPSAAMAAREPETTERSNLVGARVVLETASERGARAIFGSSFRVYGDQLMGQSIDEETPYGRVGDLSHLSKIYVEQLARMIGLPFVSVRLGVTYGLSPVMKTTPAFMTVPNLFCQSAAHGEVLRVLEDRPLAFIHVNDAANALREAAALDMTGWHVVNAAPEVATIGQIAHTVQRLMQQRGQRARTEGANGSEATFEVRSRLSMAPRWRLETGLGAVLDYFLARR